MPIRAFFQEYVFAPTRFVSDLCYNRLYLHRKEVLMGINNLCKHESIRKQIISSRLHLEVKSPIKC